MRIELADANAMPLTDNSVDLIVTDPPYGINFKSGGQLENRRTVGRPQGSKVRDKNYFDVIANDDAVPTEWLKEAFRVLRPDTGLYVFCHWKGWSTLYSATTLAGFTVKNMVVLNKSNHGMGDIKGSFAPKHELLLFASKGRHILRFPPRLKDVWDVPVKFSGAHHFHPNEKPISWMVPAILASSDPGQTILDPFCGSGSTLEAAAKNSRDFVGFDIDQKWIDIAKGRLEHVSRDYFESNRPQDVPAQAEEIADEDWFEGF